MWDNGLTLAEVAVLAGAIAFITNWLALIPWRRARDQHWTERARLLHPVRIAANNNMFMIPGVLAIGVSLCRPEDSPSWALVIIAAGLGTMIGNLPLGREVYSRIKLPDLARQGLLMWLLKFVLLGAFLLAADIMPDELNTEALDVFAGLLLFYVLWNRFIIRWISRKLRVLVLPPARLQTIATETAARMRVQFRKVWLIRSSVAQALADIRNRDVMFTERLLQILSDEEIAAICAHELGHLTEPKSERLKRSLLTTSLLPWVFLKPLVHTFGMPAFLGLTLFTLGVQALRRRISRKLESRADRIAAGNTAESGVYAHALLRLYEDNQVPAVIAQNTTTHPDLYDRMLAAGVTPDFPRPSASRQMAWHGHAFAGIFGLLLAILVIRMIGTFSGLN